MAKRTIKNKTQHPMYGHWAAMRQRCNDPKIKGAKYWSEKGINFDPKWDRFEEFCADMSDGFSADLWLDRIDNSKRYSKDNCRWATPKEQQRNRTNNNRLEFAGKSLLLSEWSELTGVKRSTLAQRYYVYRWPIYRVLKEAYLG